MAHQLDQSQRSFADSVALAIFDGDHAKAHHMLNMPVLPPGQKLILRGTLYRQKTRRKLTLKEVLQMYQKLPLVLAKAYIYIVEDRWKHCLRVHLAKEVDHRRRDSRGLMREVQLSLVSVSIFAIAFCLVYMLLLCFN